MKTNTYTVIGFYESSGQICADSIRAKTGENALKRAAKERGKDNEGDNYSLIVAILGSQTEGKAATYPGDSVTDCKTYLEVFKK